VLRVGLGGQELAIPRTLGRKVGDVCKHIKDKLGLAEHHEVEVFPTTSDTDVKRSFSEGEHVPQDVDALQVFVRQSPRFYMKEVNIMRHFVAQFKNAGVDWIHTSVHDFQGLMPASLRDEVVRLDRVLSHLSLHGTMSIRAFVLQPGEVPLKLAVIDALGCRGYTRRFFLLKRTGIEAFPILSFIECEVSRTARLQMLTILKDFGETFELSISEPEGRLPLLWLSQARDSTKAVLGCIILLGRTSKQIRVA
jgi:hypothetical protein